MIYMGSKLGDIWLYHVYMIDGYFLVEMFKWCDFKVFIATQIMWYLLDVYHIFKIHMTFLILILLRLMTLVGALNCCI